MNIKVLRKLVNFTGKLLSVSTNLVVVIKYVDWENMAGETELLWRSFLKSDINVRKQSGNSNFVRNTHQDEEHI